MAGPSRVLIDCSHAVRCGNRTGVQRVVWNLAKEAENCAAELNGSGVKCQSTVFHNDGFWPLDAKQTPLSLRMRSDILSQTSKAYRAIANQVCRIFPASNLKKWLLPEAGHLGVFRSSVRRQELCERRARRRAAGWTVPGRGDILLLPDAYWCQMKIWPKVAEARLRGTLVAVVIYDLIPLTHPQYVPPGSDVAFLDYLRCAVENADLLIAISDTVRDQCTSEIAKRWPEQLNTTKISSFRLGAELGVPEGNPSPEIQKLFSPRNSNTPYLMVSTFDPRTHAHSRWRVAAVCGHAATGRRDL